jgi:hypothetical protein
VVAEMEERYRLMSSFAVRNIAGYNEKAEKAILDGEKLMRKVQTGYDPTTGKPIIEEIEFEPKSHFILLSVFFPKLPNWSNLNRLILCLPTLPMLAT